MCRVMQNGFDSRRAHKCIALPTNYFMEYICRYCGSLRKNNNSLRNHERLCKENPNKELTFFETHKAAIKHTNQFLKAKELGLNVESKLKGRVSPFKGKHHSDESKKKASETMKRKIEDGSFIVPYKRNHSSKVSYPEKYFMEVFKGLPVEYNYQVGLYQLDFAIPEKKLYIEIDGEQHYVDKKIVEHDKVRTEKLSELGWTCVKRVRWSEFKKLSEKEKVLFCNVLKSNFMSR